MCDKSPLTLFDGVYIHPESYGCVLVIGAWNFPLLLTLAPVLPALAAGNAVVMKPSEISPATARALQDLIPKYLDDRCVKVQRSKTLQSFVQDLLLLCRLSVEECKKLPSS